MTTKMREHVLLSGERIEYQAPRGAVAKHLERLFGAAEDASVDEAAMTELVYGLENPLLDRTMLPGRAVITAAVHRDPVWHVMQDLLGRKRVQTGTLDPVKARARFTMTVGEAAALLGVTEGAVRQAIHARRLPSWKGGGTYYLDPASVGSFRVSRRGPKPRAASAETSSEPAPPPSRVLAVRIGSAPGVSFSLRHAGELAEQKREGRGQTSGRLEDWQRVAVMIRTGEDARMLVLEPADEDAELEVHGFFVRGRFRVVAKVNNAVKAREQFRSFIPE